MSEKPQPFDPNKMVIAKVGEKNPHARPERPQAEKPASERKEPAEPTSEDILNQEVGRLRTVAVSQQEAVEAARLRASRGAIASGETIGGASTKEIQEALALNERQAAEQFQNSVVLQSGLEALRTGQKPSEEFVSQLEGLVGQKAAKLQANIKVGFPEDIESSRRELTALQNLLDKIQSHA